MRLRVLLLSFALTCAASAQDGILPKSFSGWQKSAPKISKDAATVGPQDAPALKEYGFRDSEQATYTRDGRSIALRALRFSDGTGGFGAFTYLREPGMVSEKLCDRAASAREHILIHCADIVIEAKWDRITAMTMADLRVLTQALGTVTGPAAQGPNIPPSLRNVEDIRLALGPAAYGHFAALPGWAELIPPASSIDFERSAEALLAPVEGGRAITTVVRYPTPRIAIQELPKYEEWSKQAPPDAAERNINSLVKRSGPIVAAVRGQIGTDEARSALDPINYEADVTWSEATGLEKRNNIGGLVYAAILLAIIIFGFAVIGGIVFGGFRVILRKLFPGRFIDRAESVEFIKLNLED
jgi:hypothetical protein